MSGERGTVVLSSPWPTRTLKVAVSVSRVLNHLHVSPQIRAVSFGTLQLNNILPHIRPYLSAFLVVCNRGLQMSFKNLYLRVAREL